MCQRKTRVCSGKARVYVDGPRELLLCGFVVRLCTAPMELQAAKEVFVGDSPSPRISVGFGVNWNSPFGPFRIDVSRVLKKQLGDDTKVFSFNVGTQF